MTDFFELSESIIRAGEAVRPLPDKLYEYEVTGIEYVNKWDRCATTSCVVEFQLIRDGAAVVPEIHALYFEEWVERSPWFEAEARWAFQQDWDRRLVPLRKVRR